MHKPDWRSGQCHQQHSALTDIQHDISLVCLLRHAQLRPIDCNGLYDCEYRTVHVSQAGLWATIDLIKSIRVRFVRLLCLLCISVRREGTSEEQRRYNITTTFNICPRAFEECKLLAGKLQYSVLLEHRQTTTPTSTTHHRNGLPSHPPRMASPHGSESIHGVGIPRNGSSTHTFRNCRPRHISRCIMESRFRCRILFESATNPLCLCELSTYPKYASCLVFFVRDSLCLCQGQSLMDGQYDKFQRSSQRLLDVRPTRQARNVHNAHVVSTPQHDCKHHHCCTLVR